MEDASFLLIDPFGLLGVNVNSEQADVRRAYLDLALIAHPDKGGSAEQMRVLHSAYMFVTAQITGVNRTRSVEDLEREFAEFCRDQVEEGGVPTRSISEVSLGCPELSESFESRTRRAASFNARFEEAMRLGSSDMGETSGGFAPPQAASVPGGYGDLMARSHRDVHGCEGSKLQDDIQIRETFAMDGMAPLRYDVIVYSEPVAAAAVLAGAATALQLPNRLDDYSIAQPIGMCDYRVAYNETPERMDGMAGSVGTEGVVEAFERLLEERGLELRAADHGLRTKRF